MLVVGVFAAVSSVAACGPSLYTFNVLPASAAVEQAREANAEEHAPYEIHLAMSYLEKAREEAAEANYQDAIRFAERANEYATKARDLARRRMRESGR
jgi:Tfp pilus assembly protein PilF